MCVCKVYVEKSIKKTDEKTWQDFIAKDKTQAAEEEEEEEEEEFSW